MNVPAPQDKLSAESLMTSNRYSTFPFFIALVYQNSAIRVKAERAETPL
jgi:hypothetical protein